MTTTVPSEKLSIVFVTAPTQEVAAQLAQELVTQRLAACVTISPVRSVFSWKGQLEQVEECLLIIKTRQNLFPELQEYIIAHHPYEVPEIVEVITERVTEKYLQWVVEETMLYSARG